MQVINLSQGEKYVLRFVFLINTNAFDGKLLQYKKTPGRAIIGKEWTLVW